MRSDQKTIAKIIDTHIGAFDLRTAEMQEFKCEIDNALAAAIEYGRKSATTANNITIELSEQLTQANHSSGFLIDNVKESYHRACIESPVASLVLLDLIKASVEIQQKIKSLQTALAEK